MVLPDLSRRDKVSMANGNVVVTGFSCCCLVKRHTGQLPMHPVEVLQDALANIWRPVC